MFPGSGCSQSQIANRVSFHQITSGNTASVPISLSVSPPPNIPWLSTETPLQVHLFPTGSSNGYRWQPVSDLEWCRLFEKTWHNKRFAISHSESYMVESNEGKPKIPRKGQVFISMPTYFPPLPKKPALTILGIQNAMQIFPSFAVSHSTLSKKV